MTTFEPWLVSLTSTLVCVIGLKIIVPRVLKGGEHEA